KERSKGENKSASIVIAKACVINKLGLLTSSSVDDNDDDVRTLEKQQSSKYKLKLFTLYKSLKTKSMRIMKRKQQK
ncbi:MAG TPA: hypothetical protein VHF08_06025, partial [Nitrososphaeraceae archaeon]|nr:hypothetical protein [Nitrososphaeraceae archaeon]